MSDDPDARQLRKVARLLKAELGCDYELDLCGLDLAHALASIDRMVGRQRFRDQDRSVYIRLDPATGSAEGTLFQPVVQHLLGLIRRGLVSHCRPDAAEGRLGLALDLPAGKRAC